MPHTWNNGILLLRERYSSINLAVKRNFADVPIFHFPKTQYSNIPIVSEAN
jgi:hypothetical protein